MTLYQVLHELQIVLALILGACPLCCQPVTLDRLSAALSKPNKVLLGACLKRAVRSRRVAGLVFDYLGQSSHAGFRAG